MRNSRNKNVASLLITALLIAILIGSSPVGAIFVDISLPDEVNLEESKYLKFVITANLQTREFLPLSTYVRVLIEGPQESDSPQKQNYEFWINGTAKYGNIQVTPKTISANYGYGYGYAYAYGYGYYLGYGYGYGYGYSYQNILKYEVRIDVSNYNLGNYKLRVEVVHNGKVLAHAEDSFKIVRRTVVYPSEEEPESEVIVTYTEPGEGELTLWHIYKDKPVRIDLSNIENISVFEIEINVKDYVRMVKLEIERVDTVPVAKKPEGEVFSYLRLTLDISEELVDYIKIRFKVSKEWLKENSIDANTITLLRYKKEGDIWEKLNTTKIGEDTNHVYYEATVKGFSYFAIVGKEKVTPSAPAPTPEEEVKPPEEEVPISPEKPPMPEKPPEVKPPEEVTPTLPEKPPEEIQRNVTVGEVPAKGKPWKIIIGCIIAILVIVAAAILYKKKYK